MSAEMVCIRSGNQGWETERLLTLGGAATARMDAANPGIGQKG